MNQSVPDPVQVLGSFFGSVGNWVRTPYLLRSVGDPCYATCTYFYLERNAFPWTGPGDSLVANLHSVHAPARALLPSRACMFGGVTRNTDMDATYGRTTHFSNTCRTCRMCTR